MSCGDPVPCGYPMAGEDSTICGGAAASGGRTNNIMACGDLVPIGGPMGHRKMRTVWNDPMWPENWKWFCGILSINTEWVMTLWAGGAQWR